MKVYIRMGVLYVTYLLYNDSVYHLEEVTGEYQSITETPYALECSYVTKIFFLEIISESLG